MAITVTPTFSRDNSGVQGGSTARDLLINYNRLVEIVRQLAGDALLQSVTLSIGGTDTSVATTAFNYQIGGLSANKTAVTAGTALAAGTIPQDQWGIYLVQVASGGTISMVAGAANFTTGYATEEQALAALPAGSANNVVIGWFTVKTGAGENFVGNTDALAGGSSGDPASVTNYYSAPSIGDLSGFLAKPIGDLNGEIILV